MAQQKHVGVGRISLAVAVLICLAAGVYLKSSSNTVAEPVVVENEALKQPLKSNVELEDDAVVGFKPF